MGKTCTAPYITVSKELFCIFYDGCLSFRYAIGRTCGYRTHFHGTFQRILLFDKFFCYKGIIIIYCNTYPVCKICINSVHSTGTFDRLFGNFLFFNYFFYKFCRQIVFADNKFFSLGNNRINRCICRRKGTYTKRIGFDLNALTSHFGSCLFCLLIGYKIFGFDPSGYISGNHLCPSFFNLVNVTTGIFCHFTNNF